LLQSALHNDAPVVEYYYTGLLNLSYLYWIKGRSLEAMSVLERIDRNTLAALSGDLTVKYYEACRRLYRYYADSEDDINCFYRIQSNLYLDSLLLTVPRNSLSFGILTAEKLHNEKRTVEAIQALNATLSASQPTGREQAIMTGILADFYRHSGNVAMQKKYYAISAINDIENAIKENTSMMSLATLLYSEGDIDNAYRCIQSSMDDAVFSNAYFRTLALSKIFPLINSAYQKKISAQKRELLLYLSLAGALLVFLCWMTYCVWQQMKRITRIRKELYDTNIRLNDANKDLQESNARLQELNSRLSTVNRKLSESHKIKEAYLSKYIDLSSNYIEKIDNYRRSLNKIANSGKIEELYLSLKSTRFIE
jgi:hypothetical protein